MYLTHNMNIYNSGKSALLSVYYLIRLNCNWRITWLHTVLKYQRVSQFTTRYDWIQLTHNMTIYTLRKHQRVSQFTTKYNWIVIDSQHDYIYSPQISACLSVYNLIWLNSIDSLTTWLYIQFWWAHLCLTTTGLQPWSLKLPHKCAKAQFNWLTTWL